MLTLLRLFSAQPARWPLKCLLLFSLMALPWLAQAQCPTGDDKGNVYLRSQADVNAFPPGCTNMPGSLFIQAPIAKNNDVTDLRPLRALQSISRTLVISGNTSLTTLTGLSSLTSVDGVTISYNTVLTDLTSLSALSQVGGTLAIIGNDQLASLAGLTNLTISPRGSLIIVGNPLLTSIASLSAAIPTQLFQVTIQATQLTNLTGLENLTSVSGPIFIESNPLLTSIASLSGVTQTAEVEILKNAKLTNLTGLDKLTSVSFLFIIGNASLTNIASLSGVTQTDVDLSIDDNAQLTNLRGLDNLTRVGGNLRISDNPRLTSVASLSRVTQTGGQLFIQNNTQLPNLTGLEKLTNVGGDLIIDNNPALTSIASLSGVTQTGEDLQILFNGQLTNLRGLDNLTRVGNTLRIDNNASLTSIASLSALTQTGTDILIYNNPQLGSLTGLNKLTTVGGNLIVSGNPVLTSIAGLSALTQTGGSFQILGLGYAQLGNLTGLGRLTTVGGDLVISGNPVLTSIASLSALTQTGGNFQIANNAQLTNLTGLSRLTTVGNGLRIESNSALTNIAGLSALTQLRYLVIQNNTRLGQCAIDPVCQFLAVLPDYVTISGNAAGCSSEAEVQRMCTTPLAITTQPPSQSAVCAGSTVMATVSTVGNAQAYQWYKGNQAVSGQTSATLTMTNVQPADAGTYRVVVSNSVSSLTSTAFTLTVNSVSADYQPLVDLYNSTNGAGWTRKDNWVASCSPCGWYGVSCNGNGRVTGLNLIGNNLSGTLPASLSALTALQSLELGANALTGGIPTGISNLTALQTLNLSRTQLGGTIPISLGGLTRLQSLFLNQSALTGSLPAGLGGLGQLQNLNLNLNQLSGCFPGSYTALCGKSVSFADNPGLPGGGDFGAFCRDGSGGTLVVSQGPRSGTACVGSTFSFSVVAQGAASYQWYKLGPAQGQFQQLAESGPVLSFSNVSASDAGNYQVVINYACGNGALQSDVVTLTVPQPGTAGCPQVNTPPVATANASQTAMVGRVFSYTVNAFSDAETPNSLTYSASLNPANGLSFDAATRAISGMPSQPGPVSVTVTATDGGGLSASTSFTITVNPRSVSDSPLRFSNLTASPSTLLTTETTILSATVSGGTSPYRYSFSGPGTITPNGNTATVSGLPTGVQTFTVLVTDASSPIPQTASATVSVTVSPASSFTASLSASPSTTLTCAQTSLTLTAGGADGPDYTYAFSPNVTSQRGNTAVVNAAGVYSVTVTNTSSGYVSTASITIFQETSVPTATLSASPSTTLTCAQTSLTLTASGGNAYAFSPNVASQNGNTAVVNTAGVYSVRVTNTATGCFSTTSITVYQDAIAPTVSITPSSATLTCASPSVSLTAVGVGNVLWSTGSTERVITVNTAGTYSMTITNGNGCSASASTTISVDQSVPVVSINPNSATLTCASTTISLTAVGVGNVLWSTGSAERIITVNTAGTYSVTITNGNGCSASASVVIGGSQSAPVVSINPSSATLTCASPTVSLTAVGGGSVLWSTGSTERVITVNTASIYSVTITNGNGCSASASVIIGGDQSAPTVSITGSLTVVPGGTTTLTASGGGSYRWSTGQTTPGISATAGTYSLTATTANGCFATASATVSTGAPTNTAPTVANLVSPQSATVGVGYTLSVATTFTDAQTPNSLSLTVAGLPGGISLSGTTISGSPSTTVGSPYSVTLTARDPGGLSGSTVFTLSVSPAVSMTTVPTAPLAITGVTTIDCTPVANRVNLSFNPQYAGLNGTPVSFSVANELAPTTDGGPYTLSLYADNPVITLRAVQSGVSSSFTYNWLTACNSQSATPGGNTAPTVANAIPPQSATVGQGFSYVIPVSTFTDAQTPNSLVLSVAGLPAGLNFTAPATISGSASGSGVSSVTVTASDPGNLSVSTIFTITVRPASMTTTPPGVFALTGVTTVSCTPVGNRVNLSFTPQYASLTGSGVRFEVLNELAPTTDGGPYTLSLYADNPVITLRAVQSGVSSSFAYNWLAACSSLSATPGNTAPTVANTIPPQSATVGVGFSYLIPAGTFTDAQTPTALVLSATGLPAGLNLVGTTISGVPSMSGVSTVTVTASDPGNLSVSTIFTITVSPASMTTTPIGTFSITGVTGVSCQTLSAGLRRLTFSPVYSGLNGQAVSFGVVNELGTTTAAGPYSLNLYTDNPVITLKASQLGSAGASSFAYSWLSSCPAFVASGRLGSAEESGSGLRVTVLGNPVHGSSVTVDIRGGEGQPLHLSVTDQSGHVVSVQEVEQAGAIERQKLELGHQPAGLLLLRVSTPIQTKTLKLLKAD